MLTNMVSCMPVSIPSVKEEARLVYRKAKQVSSVTYNLFTIAKKLDSDPPIRGMSAPAEVRESVKKELTKRYPTMESLFGSMDFCECEHCRSVLSPAAYLVDLLQFIDVDAEQGVWDSFLKGWKEKHMNQEYTDMMYKKPYEVLIDRRPDLPHIPLTCENTHTALPYIDVVNEILEYYVANGKLEEKAAHDTGETTTAELLAEPQNVIREAYDKLLEARYPLNLPFDLWIETVRQFCNYFEVPLEHVLEVFRPGDGLFASTQPFDRFSIFIESLGLSSAESSIFSDPDPLKLGKWHELFGYPKAKIDAPSNASNATVNVANAAADLFRVGNSCSYYEEATGLLLRSGENREISAIGAKDSGGPGKAMITFVGIWVTPPKAGDILVLANVPELLSFAKTLSRRLGVTYKELVEIVQTGFVNPKLAKLGILYKLNVSIQQILFYRDHKKSYEQNKDLLDKERSSLSTADQKRFDELSKRNLETGKTGLEDLNEVKAFEQRLIDMKKSFKASGFDPSAWLNDALQNNSFDDILVLADPDTGCNFDLTTLSYASGRMADDITFLRINLFVRLWRKLGWTIDETDHALQAFLPKNTPFEKAHLDKQPLKTALIYLAHLKALDHKARLGKQSRMKLLTLWSDISTNGKKSLYAQLFLTSSMLKSDDVFDHPLGQYLSASGIAAMAQTRKHKVRLEKVALGDKIDPALFAAEPKVEVSYDVLQEVQHLAFEGVLNDAEKAALKALSTSPVLHKLLDAVQIKGKEFALVKGHLLAMQSAFGLTADEIGRILKDAGRSLSLGTAELSLAHASLLYRYGLLAKALNLSVQELIVLKQLSGIDPFKPLHPDPLTNLNEEKDYPFFLTLQLVEMAERVNESGLKIEDLEYLLRHRFDETGKYRPNRENTLALLKTLAEGIQSIRAEHAVPEDPGAMSEEVLLQKLGLALPPNVVEQFHAMLNGTVEFTATETGVVPSDKLELKKGFADEHSIRDLHYNDARQEQKLTFRGVLFDPEKNALIGRLPKPVPPNPHVPSPILGTLLQDVQQQARSFFEKHLQKQAPTVQPAAGFLDKADFDLLFDPNLALAAGETEQSRVRNRRTKLANAFLPFLQQRLIRQFIVQTLTAQTAAAEAAANDPTLVESLLTDSRLLGIVQPGGDTRLRPLLDLFAAAAEMGITAKFFPSVDGTGAAMKTVSLVDANTSLKDHDGNPLRPAGANSARLEGYLEVPTPGAYRFYVRLEKQNAEAELRFAHLTKPTLTGAAIRDGDSVGNGPDEYAELKPGIPFRFTLDLRKLNGGDAQLLVQGETLPKDTLAKLVLHPATAIEGAERALGLLTKVLQLLQGLVLSERETRYLLTHAKDFEGLNLSNLPTQRSDDTPASSVAATERFAQFLRLAGYARLKRDLAGGTDDLIGIFEFNGTSDLDKVYTLIANLTRRDDATVRATAKAVFAAAGATAANFASEKPLQRLWEALQIVERFGVPVQSLLEWTRVVSPTADQEQRFSIARDLKEAIKARFEPETWQRVAQPIFDKLRQRQRDSLVAHIMVQHDFARMEQLYEYFLIDPGMEPVVQTSRIRLAIATMQLFVQRCMLNLEPKVHPSAILNARHWEWMKRYRLWEANRKIFLFPENWLEPEFRDDKTHLFSELEGTMLQGDVSSDLVEDAFLNYLKKLDELARLDIVAMHLEDKTNPAQNTLHVFGRTYSSPHKHFYRRYVHEQWTPWEPVTAEIDGDHLAPVIWRDRLYLFWVTFIEKPIQNGNNPPIDPTKEIPVPPLKTKLEAQLHWSEYLQGQWSTRESGGFFAPDSEKSKANGFGDLGSTLLVTIGEAFGETTQVQDRRKAVFVHVSKEPYEKGEERGVYVHLSAPFYKAFYLAGRNSVPEMRDYNPRPVNPYSANDGNGTRYLGSGPFKVSYAQRITSTEAEKWTPVMAIQDILRQGREYTLLPCDNNISKLGVSEDSYKDADDPSAVKAAIDRGIEGITSLIKPVFYQDNEHTFFIQPNVTERTIEEYQEWVPRPSRGEQALEKPDYLEKIPVIPQKPWDKPILDPEVWRSDSPVYPDSVIKLKTDEDWLVNPGTVLLSEGELIGPGGRAELEIGPSTEVADSIAKGGMLVNVNPGSSLATGDIVVLPGTVTLKQTGLTLVAGGLNIVGNDGFNPSLAKNFREFNQAGFGAGMSNAGGIGG